MVIDWDYLNVAERPSCQQLEGDRAQGGRRRLLLAGHQRDAPHPAAARLWQEYLYSDEGQNLWLKGGARPVRFDAMKAAGTLDTAAAAGPAARRGHPVVPTQADAESGKNYLAEQLGQRRWLTPRVEGTRRTSAVGCPPGCRPFFAYTTVFLLIPTLVVLVGAFLDGDGSFTLGNVQASPRRPCCVPLRHSVVLSAVTAAVAR